MSQDKLPIGTKIVAGSFLTSGVVHMVKPDVFEPLVPPQLGSRRTWVYASGGAELACAAGLLTRQRWAPAATAGTLAAVWVGNVYMATAWQRSAKISRARKALAWARVPLQLPLIWWAWQSPANGRQISRQTSP
ncbi:MAG: DoxX family protein [Actinomycetia bacterium]|nr:DoxX family protein [Actinomycetes bacterium]